MGTNQPIELPQSNDPRKKQRHGGAPRQREANGRQENLQQDETVRRSRRYYDESDDMIDRVRRVRAAFEKRINGFQGADWPHYLKRTIIGKKKAEPLTPAESAVNVGKTSRRETSIPTLPFPPERPRS